MGRAVMGIDVKGVRLVDFVPAPRGFVGLGVPAKRIKEVRVSILERIEVNMSADWSEFRQPFLDARRALSVALREIRRGRDYRKGES
jgi:hypothetical protein